MSEIDDVRVRHILDAAREAVSFSKGRCRADLDTDRKLNLSLVRLLEIIGEAAKNVSDELKDKFPQIPWKDLAGVRDKLIHHYFGVNFDIVWNIVKQELPDVLSQLEEI